MRIEGFGHGSDVIMNKANWFRRYGTPSKENIISLLFQERHRNADIGSGKGGIFACH